MNRMCLMLGAVLGLAGLLNAAEPALGPTLMTRRGKLLISDDFTGPLAPLAGTPRGFASGFTGWRCNIAERGGNWKVIDGTFTGFENPKVSHPATASRGFGFKNVVIQCDLRMNNAPLDGRKYRYMMIRTTDEKDYVCSIHLSEKGLRITKDDNDHGGPDQSVPLGQVDLPVKLGEWVTVVFEILGDEMVGTLNGKSATGRHPLIASEKHSVMFVSGVEGGVRNFRVWEAEPNPEWPANKAKLAAPGKNGVSGKTGGK